MNEVTQLDFNVPELNVKYPRIRNSPKYLPKQYFIGLICAARGMGKTTVLMKMLLEYDKLHSFDRIFVFCPTVHSDLKYKLLQTMDTDLHIYDEYSDELFTEVFDEIKAGIQAQKDYVEKMKLYRRWIHDKNDLRDWGTDLLSLEAMKYKKPECPVYCRNGQPPTSLLVFDDLVGSSLYKPQVRGPANTMFIAHRHYLTSIIFCTQVYHGAVPRQLRTNLSFVILFANKNKGMCKEIASEFSSYISIEKFQSYWDQATVEPHSFMFVDFEAPKEHRFRIGFDRAFTQ